MAATLSAHQHGKGKIRVARVWRDGDKHHFSEWSVNTMLESDMGHAYLTDSNMGMTPTDTQKNTVYYMAKKMPLCSPEEFAIALAKHFESTYPLVSKCKVSLSQVPWERVAVAGVPHQHGFQLQHTETRTVQADYSKSDGLVVTAGLTDWKVLKTTQSGYEGYLVDEYSLLKPTRERIVASSVTATWRYSAPLPDYNATYAAVKEALASKFYGPPEKGTYSPSVQFTLYRMGKAVIDTVSAVESVYLNMPNIHFLPCNPVNSEPFANDVYVATSEPHGDIEATVTRGSVAPHCKL